MKTSSIIRWRPVATEGGSVQSDEESWAGQLAAPGYHINTGGKLVIESKAEMAKRGVASPDDADALALTFACSVAPGGGGCGADVLEAAAGAAVAE